MACAVAETAKQTAIPATIPKYLMFILPPLPEASVPLTFDFPPAFTTTVRLGVGRQGAAGHLQKFSVGLRLERSEEHPDHLFHVHLLDGGPGLAVRRRTYRATVPMPSSNPASVTGSGAWPPIGCIPPTPGIAVT